ncbi:bifunctional ADP-dependent NAD(P)H-hydrate dehydratase/NAD(P)H-hydrate epimerase [Aquimarina longa]|uniref:bifunctional ADP-dependent NAD(P)H-hydrate dehydratase/NAD(P)H-hydrate epimerase n=1 Tax=Aquimarina longa TaxID=1080221 RepID=UPI0007808927|nr:bifunctional ADP-dependent NAD(P)H-hydrate dehydratase/NAD(P)H-hydrate epimerase [Aquimarina longa]
MKIFSAEQMRMADEATMLSEKMTSLELMERAASQIFNLIHERLQGSPILIHVFCGIGNNGGDGLVISRLLLEHGYNVKTYIVNFSDDRSKDFLVNYDRLKEIASEWPTQLKCEEDFPQLQREDMIIDAIFGIGLNRPIVPWVVSLIKHLNTTGCFTLSIDIPSGLYTDKGPDDPEGVIFADVTVTFQLPKLVFFLPETGGYTQDLEVIDIGLDRDFLIQNRGIGILMSKNEIVSLYRPRHKFSHKGTYGHCVIIGGSYGKIGSVVLATKAALRTGVGLATAYIPECGYEVVQIAVPEAMVIADSDDELEEITLNFKPAAIGIGIGIGTSEKTVKAFGEFIKENESSLVIDADGINILAKNPDFLKIIPKRTILTPHPKELKRLIGEWEDDFDKIKKTQEFSKKHNCIIIIKGANSITVFEDQLYVNTTGNPGMATAGSGDVLTGMITALLSQGYPPLHAAVFGVFLHGNSADIAIQKTGFEGLIASEIISHIGPSFLELFKRPSNEQPKK